MHFGSILTPVRNGFDLTATVSWAHCNRPCLVLAMATLNVRYLPIPAKPHHLPVTPRYCRRV